MLPESTYALETWLWLPRSREEVFAFFADAMNLERITPSFLKFRVRTAAPIAMGAGTVIDYRIGMRGLPMTWRSEITTWDPPQRFVDTQLKGPYREWVHTHSFEEQDGGTTVRDHVRYRLPGPAFAGALVNRWLVASDLKRIFEYRHEALVKAFGVESEARRGPVVLR
jgi:ligand-binding SRPBCC domain-containing protein